MTYEKARRTLADAVVASRAASDQDKVRAKEAQASLGSAADPDRAFVYNAFLNLLHRGVRPTEANILTEAKAMFSASQAFFEGHPIHGKASVAA